MFAGHNPQLGPTNSLEGLGEVPKHFNSSRLLLGIMGEVVPHSTPTHVVSAPAPRFIVETFHPLGHLGLPAPNKQTSGLHMDPVQASDRPETASRFGDKFNKQMPKGFRVISNKFVQIEELGENLEPFFREREGVRHSSNGLPGHRPWHLDAHLSFVPGVRVLGIVHAPNFGPLGMLFFKHGFLIGPKNPIDHNLRPVGLHIV